MSTDANERASIGGVKAAAGGLGTLCAGYLGLGLIDWIGGADEQAGFVYFGVTLGALTIVRSEEHTSELQSLMRISYAVFCLKKKTNRTENGSKSPDTLIHS